MSELEFLERFWIDVYNTRQRDFGYNVAEARYNLKSPLSPELARTILEMHGK